MHRFLATLRRRLRMVSALTRAQLVAPAVAAAALALVVIGRLRPWAWPEPLALATVTLAAAAVACWARWYPLPDLAVAGAADRGLHTRDLFVTHLEFRSSDGPFAAELTARAHRMATEARPAAAAPVRVDRRRVALAGVLGLLALLLALLPNDQDARRHGLAAEREAIDGAASALTTAADDVSEAPGGKDQAERLRSLSRDLTAADDLGDAAALVDAATGELAASNSNSAALATRAATTGLARTLGAEPLPGAGPDQGVADQLRAAGRALDTLDPAALGSLADRLDELATSQELGDAVTAGALAAAADSLRRGDTETAATALDDAAASHDDAMDADASSAGDQAARALAEARQRLDAAGPPGQTSAATGAGRGAGPAPDDGTDPHSADGPDPTGSTGEQPDAVAGPAVEVGASNATGSGDPVGSASITDRSSGIGLPAGEVPAVFVDDAVRSVDTMSISPAMRQVVRDYFAAIAAPVP